MSDPETDETDSFDRTKADDAEFEAWRPKSASDEMRLHEQLAIVVAVLILVYLLVTVYEHSSVYDTEDRGTGKIPNSSGAIMQSSPDDGPAKRPW